MRPEPTSAAAGPPAGMPRERPVPPPRAGGMRGWARSVLREALHPPTLERSGPELRALRESIGWTEEEAGAALAVAPDDVRAWEAGLAAASPWEVRDLLRHARAREVDEACRAAGIPVCAPETRRTAWAEVRERLRGTVARRVRHVERCAACRARRAIADRMPPIPAFGPPSDAADGLRYRPGVLAIGLAYAAAMTFAGIARGTAAIAPGWTGRVLLAFGGLMLAGAMYRVLPVVLRRRFGARSPLVWGGTGLAVGPLALFGAMLASSLVQVDVPIDSGRIVYLLAWGGALGVLGIRVSHALDGGAAEDDP